MEEKNESTLLLSKTNKKKQKYGDIKDIISIMTGFSIFSSLETGVGAGVGAGIGAIVHSSLPSVTASSGAFLGAVSAGIPFGLAWVTLPLSIKSWVYCQLFRNEHIDKHSGDCNHFLLSKTFWFSCLFAIPSIMIPIVSTAISEPVFDIPIAKGCAIGVVTWLAGSFLAPAFGYPAAKVMTLVDECLHSGEDKRKFCV